MLAELSYQYEPLLESLRELWVLSIADPEKQAIQDAATFASRQINLYENIGRIGTSATEKPDRCRMENG